MSELFAGIDSSTQSCKLLVINPSDNAVVFSESVNFDKDLPQYNTENGVMKNMPEGVSESDPTMWIDALHMLFDKLKKSSVPIDKIRVISVSGQQHGLVTLDAEGNLTRKQSKLWNDFSTAEECRLMTEAVGGVDNMIDEVGNSQRTGYTAAKIHHFVRHEPEAFAKTTTCFLVHNFVNWYLTGGKDNGVRVMEPGDTSGMALWHPGKRKWSEDVMNAISPELKDKIPPLKPSDQTIGHISAALVKQYGFSPECKIDAGCGDNMYGAVGTGNVEPGLVTISLGTSGTAYSFMNKAYIDPDGEIAAFCDSTGNYLPLLCVSNLANGYNAILKKYNLSHDEFNAIVAKTPAGCKGRMIFPWYEGERTPDLPFAAPLYFGFQFDDFTPEWLCRAILEAHVLNLYEGFIKMPIKPKEIRLTGGMAQSEQWCQAIADIFEASVVPVEGEGAAMGAALHAAWVYQKEQGKSVTLKSVVDPFVKLVEKKRKEPNRKNVEIYRQVKKIYLALSARVRGVGADADPFALRSELLKMY
ncbi:hypothetical protein JW960_23310 [candidate division KSB1 bacterium]|nr:hypothetical protein [candidate division KSB1 bacterium]